MKNILLIILLVVINFSFAQTNYEVFGVNGKFGIVEKKTNNEFIKPTYTKYTSLLEDYIVFLTKTDFILYNKISGNKIAYTKGQDDHFFLLPTNTSIVGYEANYHVIENNKSVVINNKAEKRKLSKKYLKIAGLSGMLLGFTEKSINIFTDNKLNVPKITVNALNFIEGDFAKRDEENEEKFYVFYNKNKTYVYSDLLDLVKIYEEGGDNDESVFKIIQNDFIEKDERSIGRENFGVKTYITEGNKSPSSIKIEDFAFSVKENSKIRYLWGFITIKNDITKENYYFSVNYKEKQIYLPKKYQEQLDLQILD